ncbi:hypothetical protein EMCG_02810 [[Emmonsia] crescens]|uniref:Uncharacterized protein n=1 Tax=[Emmonsia] crescens TaxID=73230 RepID=A0A0G2HYD0_9EURO|nr:hypothetical protein EMCG_02810 [Emmonsia crescens UAMH 3008]
MAAIYGDEFPSRSHAAQKPSYLPPDIHAKMISTQSTPDLSSQLKQQLKQQEDQELQRQQQQQQQVGVPTDSHHNHHHQYQEQYQLDDKLYYYQKLQIEQQWQQFQYQCQHQQPSNRNNPKRYGEPSTRHPILPRLDTSSPTVRPRAQPIKPPRFYADLLINAPASASASATTSIPPSPSDISQTPLKGLLHRASFSPFPDQGSGSTFSASRRRPASAVTLTASAAPISTPATAPSSSESAFHRLVGRFGSAPSPPMATKPRTFFGGIVSSSRKGRRLAKNQKPMPCLSDVGVVAHPKKELKHSQSMFRLLGTLMRREK